MLLLGFVPQPNLQYFGSTPIALLKDNSTYRIYAAQIDTPRVITENQTNQTLWIWTSKPFGESKPNEDVDGDQVAFNYNLRFPGQYFDQETGKHYNFNRDYDPVTGRYVQSDPIGLDGGINGYQYAKNLPTIFLDETGLRSSPPIAPWSADIEANIQEASSHCNPWWFKRQVQNRGPWDYKQQSSQYENFGNFHYGAVGMVFCYGTYFTEKLLLKEAGRAQQAAGTSKSTWGYLVLDTVLGVVNLHMVMIQKIKNILNKVLTTIVILITGIYPLILG